MKIRMQLLSDVIFGSGESVPGGEDVSVLSDESGFPYYKGGTFKGIFREELENYLVWTMPEKAEAEMERLLGTGGDQEIANPDKLVFSNFTLSDYVKRQILAEMNGEKKSRMPEALSSEKSEGNSSFVLEALSHVRTFTAVSSDGTVQEGALRQCRCVNKGLHFYSEIQCLPQDEPLVREVISMIKWVGAMRNRGFGKVKLTVVS